MNVAILAARRNDFGHRDRLWAYCRAWWEREFPDWPLHEGHHDAHEGLFSRSKCFNRAADQAEDWDVGVVIDSDIILENPDQVRAGVALADSKWTMAFCHNWRMAFNQRATEQVLAGGPFDMLQLEEEYGSFGPTFSSCMAISRPLWKAIGGFDERFEGWGCEDWAFWCACNALCAGHERITGRVYHLWHPRSREWEDGNAHYQENLKLGQRYMALRGNRAGMLALIDEWKAMRDEAKAAQDLVELL